MTLFGAFLVFSLAWWVAFLALLPIGVRSQVEQEDAIVPGTDPGAPIVPHLGRKALWATVLALAVLCITALIITYELVSIDWLIGWTGLQG